MKFYERLIILIILFLGLTVGTAGILGVYVSTLDDEPTDNNTQNIIIENIPLLEIK